MTTRGNDDNPRNSTPAAPPGSGPGRWNPDSGSRPATKMSGTGRSSRGPKAS